MLLSKAFICCFILVNVGSVVVLGQSAGVPVRNAPVYPDGYPDSATSRVSNGRISAHLEYVDRSSSGTGHRGDITRTSGRGTAYDPSSSSHYDTSSSSSSTSTHTEESTVDETGTSEQGTPLLRPHGRLKPYDPSSDREGTSYTGSTSGSQSSYVPSTGTRRQTGNPVSTSGLQTSGSQTGTRLYDTSGVVQPRRTSYRRTSPTEVHRRRYDTRTSYARQPVLNTRGQSGRQFERQTYFQECPTDNFRILIDGVECHVAVDTIGTHVCYDDRVLRDRRCCERCLQIKNHQNPGCEYGDRSRLCSSMTPNQCYTRSNRNICCQTCERLKNQNQPGCEYGDLSATCAQLPRRLCAIPENQRICCQTCERMRDTRRPECPFGDRSSQCVLITGGACYNPQVNDACCATCSRLEIGLSGCQYGDHNSVWNSPIGDLDCETYTRVYGIDACSDPNFMNRCCQSCRAYVPRQ